MSEYISKLRPLDGYVKVELDLCNYATKADLKRQQVSIHQNLLKVDLASLKSEINKLDIGKLETPLVD